MQRLSSIIDANWSSGRPFRGIANKGAARSLAKNASAELCQWFPEGIRELVHGLGPRRDERAVLAFESGWGHSRHLEASTCAVVVRCCVCGVPCECSCEVVGHAVYRAVPREDACTIQQAAQLAINLLGLMLNAVLSIDSCKLMLTLLHLS